MSKVVRSVKNVTKGYSTVQVKVRNATSNDPWGPTGTEMAEIAALTFSSPNEFYEIVEMLDKRLNDKGKNWRHVLKSLKVVDYCLHEGSEQVVTWATKNLYIIKTLREFQYIDEEGRDVGQNVRVAAKELTSLLLDEDRLRSERSDRKLWKSRFAGMDDSMRGIEGGDMTHRPRRRERPQRPTDDEDAEYRLAIEASKYEAEEDRKRREKNASRDLEDDELAKAIKLSKEEEELRKRELEESNAASLFDDAIPQPAQPQPTGYNQGYQQQGAVDWFGNPVDAQQPMTTGFLNNQYSQPTGFQPQQTGFGNGFPNGFQQQPTAFDQQNFLQPQPTLQPQQTAFAGNPYGNDLFGQQQQPQPQQQQQDNFLQPGSHNPWAMNQQKPADALKPAPTGSNNPFASSFTRAQAQQSQVQNTGPPSLNTLAEQKTAAQFNNPIMNYHAPQQQQQQQQQQPMGNQQQINQNPQHARLNALLATGDGQDTFGNVGDLRIPAQHTAPGIFVNSAGSGLNQLQASRTGNNPFLSQNFTGAPQQQNNAGFGSQQGFARPNQQGSNNLIDL
ncbi:hypothetical protein MauCBS54593_001774 [Microsporum audouinii]